MDLALYKARILLGSPFLPFSKSTKGGPYQLASGRVLKGGGGHSGKMRNERSLLLA